LGDPKKCHSFNANSISRVAFFGHPVNAKTETVQYLM